jgi:hypothetical protein
VPTVFKPGNLNLLEPSGPVMGLLYLYYHWERGDIRTKNRGPDG